MPKFTFDGAQVKNGLTILRVVREYQHDGNWSERYARRVARICIQCCLTESGLHNYASNVVPGSLQAPYDEGYVGHDHLSVGVFQQQVPMWGPVSVCQNVDRATRKFLERLLPIDLHDQNVSMQIQRVQVSGFPDGSNYRQQRDRALAFMRQHWDATATKKGSKR